MRRCLPGAMQRPRKLRRRSLPLWGRMGWNGMRFAFERIDRYWYIIFVFIRNGFRHQLFDPFESIILTLTRQQRLLSSATLPDRIEFRFLMSRDTWSWREKKWRLLSSATIFTLFIWRRKIKKSWRLNFPNLTEMRFPSRNLRMWPLVFFLFYSRHYQRKKLSLLIQPNKLMFFIL